jgi:CubicO group peptidase (beta-lactamase class C family)
MGVMHSSLTLKKILEQIPFILFPTVNSNRLLYINLSYPQLKAKKMKKLNRFFLNSLIILLILSSSLAFGLGKQINLYQNDSSAVYQNLQTDEFMNKWMILGTLPVFEGAADPLDQETQKKVFETDDPLPSDIVKSVMTGILKYKNHDYKWQYAEGEDGILDFIKVYGDTSFVTAYAYAEINMPEEKEFLMAAGSDDGIKIWINQEKVHENWVGRPLQKDEDLFQAKFKKGRNDILIKVQNMQYAWSFSFRALGQSSFTEKLVDYSTQGNLDAVKLLINNNADINSSISSGLTPLQAARKSGRKKIADFLIEKGARTDISMPPPEKLVDAVFNEVIKENYPGAAILIAKDGKIVYENAYGFADIENRIPVRIDTKFRIGSITKQFTAAAILKLQEKGMLSLNDPLSKFIPDFPRGDEVKIHHLLTHTSGIHSFTNEPDFLNKVIKEVDPEDLIEDIKKFEYEFNPGDKLLYNNSGYFILGYIIEKVSGMSYNEFLKDNLFDPAGMKNTGVHTSSAKLENEALGYSYQNDSVSKALNWDMSWAGGAGSLYSTVEDLFKWNEALFSGKILKDESLQAAFTPVATKDSNNNAYGYGWVVTETRGLKNINHGGGLQGFNSDLARFPEQNFTAVVLLNCAPTLPGLNAASAGREISEIYLWQQMKDQETYEVNKSVSSSTYKNYEGQYEYPGGQIMTISAEDDKLFAQLSGQNKFEIFPKSENEFFWKVVDAQIIFMKDESGDVNYAVHKQAGQEFKAPRLKPKTEIKLDPSIYDSYAGEYDLGNGVKCIISREKDKIFTQVTGQPKIEIYPESETEFFLKIVSAHIKFYKDDSGKVTHLTINQGGITTKAERINK